MVRCNRCGFYSWVDVLPLLNQAAKCYHNGTVVEHDWRYKDNTPFQQAQGRKGPGQEKDNHDH